MTDQEINTAIARTCGWTDVHVEIWHGVTGFLVGFPKGKTHESLVRIPWFHSDLNAMHKAWLSLSREQKQMFAFHLSNMPEMCRTSKKNIISCHYLIVGATAYQRAKAFLLTIGKWKD